MSEPEQCIICLDPLPRPSETLLEPPKGGDSSACGGTTTAATATTTGSTSTTSAAATATTAAAAAVQDDHSYLDVVAALDCCDHIIHDACIRSWAQKTNTCPICRKIFHTVRVFNGVDGTAISTYTVQDKKQVAEFDFHQWLGLESEEDEEASNPCPICNSTDHEDVLLLCDSCDAAYHTHCIGLDHIPDGDWYCIECAHLFNLTQQSRDPNTASQSPRPQYVQRPTPRNVRGYHVRTRARLRRARRQARNADWQGPWGQFSDRFYEMSDLDLDNHDDEDEELEQFRRFQQLDRRELQRWQQRMAIANRLGAREVFANNIPRGISERLQPVSTPPRPSQETEDERRAWAAFELAREAEDPSRSSRKRKTRSVSASPAEPPAEPERKLKRPRTRRLPMQGESAASASSPVTAGPSTVRAVGESSHARNGVFGREDGGPPLVSSLLKELEPNAPFEEEAAGTPTGWRQFALASSPVISPSPSNHSSPRALSITPPPFQSADARSASPTLSLSSHIEPRYPPANYSPNRSGSDHSDSESKPRNGDHRPLELRQPRPRRVHRAIHRPEESSPTRWTMTQEEKKNINDIVKSALRPHWHAQKLTPEQYATINRDISRKLYDEVKDASSLDDDSRRTWEKRASHEVAIAVGELQS